MSVGLLYLKTASFGLPILGNSPDAPTILDATAISQTQINGHYNASANATLHVVGYTPSGGSETQTTVSGGTFSLAGLSQNTTYSIRMFAENFFGPSAWTAPVTVQTPANPTTPLADFSADNTTPTIGATVTFTDLSTNTPTSWLWNFGDGITSTLQSPTHAYVSDGSFTVSLTATNAAGSNQKTRTAYIVIVAIGDWFVDSVNGLNSNSGQTSLLPLQTISALQAKTITAGQIVSLARGSYWREQYTVPNVNFTLRTHGSGAIPVIDGADIAPASWTQPDSVTYPNVWSQSWTLASSTIDATQRLSMWADGVRPRLASGANLAAALTDLQTNGGWYPANRNAQTTTVYIKSVADPNMSGVVYELMRRRYCIYSYDSTGTNYTLTGPLELKRAISHYGAASLGFGTATGLLLRDMGIHHSVTKGTSTRNSVCIETDSSQPGSLPFTAYVSDPSALAHTYEKCVVNMDGSSIRGQTEAALGFYSHGSIGNPLNFTVSKCAVSTEGGVDTNACQQSTVNDCYFKNLNGTGVVAGPSCVIARVVLWESAQRPILNSGPFTRGGSVAGGSITDCAVFSYKGGTSIISSSTDTTPWPILQCSVQNNTGNGVNPRYSSLNYCVLNTQSNIVEIPTGSIAYTGNHNVFGLIGQANPKFSYQGTLIQLTNSLATWQSTTGQDANSVYIKSADQVSGNGIAFWLGVANGTNNGPQDGDFRINPSAKVYDGSNNARTGTFTDGVSVTLAGPQFSYDWNLDSVIAGPPYRVPTLPATVAECRTYVANPLTWNWYP